MLESFQYRMRDRTGPKEEIRGGRLGARWQDRHGSCAFGFKRCRQLWVTLALTIVCIRLKALRVRARDCAAAETGRYIRRPSWRAGDSFPRGECRCSLPLCWPFGPSTRKVNGHCSPFHRASRMDILDSVVDVKCKGPAPAASKLAKHGVLPSKRKTPGLHSTFH